MRILAPAFGARAVAGHRYCETTLQPPTGVPSMHICLKLRSIRDSAAIACGGAPEGVDG